MKLRAIIIEDHLALAQALASKVEVAGFSVAVVPTLALAGKELATQKPDLMLVDLGLPDGSGLDFVSQWKDGALPPTAIITAHGDLEHAIEARKAGVSEFLLKPVDFRALEKFLNRVKASLLARSEQRAFSAGFVGASSAMRPVFQQIAQACSSSSAVLIHGPEGSGRSHVARLVHQHAGPDQALQVIDCSVLGDWIPALNIVQDSVPGAWVVLDHVDRLAMADQVSLANRLSQGLGESRLLAICGEGGLLPQVRQHQVHPDLYYRLQGVEIALPALADRLEDLPALCALFLGELHPGQSLEFEKTALEKLGRHHWPGNLKQLRETIAQLHPRFSTGKIAAADLPEAIGGEFSNSDTTDPLTDILKNWLDQQHDSSGELPEYRDLLAGLESRLLTLLLALYDNKPSVMAQALKLNRSTLRRRLRDLGLQ